ncbi:MAG: hypothetical protein SVO96_04910 [Pseudomonadota bacterium]|nr:hypothetical protein [Pseudomonadota bacterium]
MATGRPMSAMALAVCMILSGCAGLGQTPDLEDYPDDVYGRDGWMDPYDPWRYPYTPYGWGYDRFGRYGYWGYPGWWGPPVYWIDVDRDDIEPEPSRRDGLRRYQERVLTAPAWRPPKKLRVPRPDRSPQTHPLDVRPVRPVPFPSDRRAVPARPQSPPAPPRVQPLPVPPPPVIRAPRVHLPEPQAQPPARRTRRPWRRSNGAED